MIQPPVMKANWVPFLKDHRCERRASCNADGGTCSGIRTARLLSRIAMRMIVEGAGKLAAATLQCCMKNLAFAYLCWPTRPEEYGR
jgi:hypothetical protein